MPPPPAERVRTQTRWPRRPSSKPTPFPGASSAGPAPRTPGGPSARSPTTPGRVRETTAGCAGRRRRRSSSAPAPRRAGRTRAGPGRRGSPPPAPSRPGRAAASVTARVVVVDAGGQDQRRRAGAVLLAGPAGAKAAVGQAAQRLGNLLQARVGIHRARPGRVDAAEVGPLHYRLLSWIHGPILAIRGVRGQEPNGLPEAVTGSIGCWSYRSWAPRLCRVRVPAATLPSDHGNQGERGGRPVGGRRFLGWAPGPAAWKSAAASATCPVSWPSTST